MRNAKNGVQGTENEATTSEGEEFVKYDSSLQENCSGGGPIGDSDQLEKLKQLLTILHNDLCRDQLPASVQESLIGIEGLKRLATAMTIFLTDLGGTAPEFTCEAIADEAPDLYEEFGEHRVRALCEEIQYSEIPEQSALFQEMFQTFNTQFFAARLPHYRVLVVYDLWYWETERLQIPPVSPRQLRLLALLTSPGGTYSSGFLATV